MKDYSEAKEREEINHSEIEFFGFSEKERIWVVNLLTSMRLPLGRVKKISYVQDLESHDEENRHSLYGKKGTKYAGWYDPQTQEIKISRAEIERIGGPFNKIIRGFVLRRILSHEIAHSFSPLRDYFLATPQS